MKDKKYNKNNNEGDLGKFYISMVLCLCFLFVVFMALDAYIIQKEKVKTQACMELVIFSAEWLNFELDKNNISLDQSQKDFLRFKLEELIEVENE